MRKLTKAQRLTAQRLIELAPGIQPLIEELFLRFCEKFGREPGPDDPTFFDPDADSPVPLTVERLNKLWKRLVQEWLVTKQITPETAYAMIKMGFAVTEDNKDLLSAAELDEWAAAIEEAESQIRDDNR
jgi:hypothetical protein